MSHRKRHRKPKRQSRRFLKGYTATELALATLGGLILLLVVILVLAAVVG